MRYLRLRRTAIAVLTLSITCTVLLLSACGTALGSVKTMLDRKYGIKLPSDTELVYCHYESKDSFHGDGTDYFVFKFKEEPIGIVRNFRSLNLKEGENADELKEELIAYFNGIYGLTEVIPQEYLPNWDNEIIWNYGSTLKGLPAIYYPECKQMIVCVVSI